MNNTVVVLQSNYIPWKGYFDLIQDADLFIFYDDLQYTKNDWRNRNKIKTPRGVEWLTIPVGKDNRRLICEVELSEPTWQSKHWSKIQENYQESPFFPLYRDFLEDTYCHKQWQNLSTLNHYIIRTIATTFLGLSTTFSDSREYALEGRKLHRLIELLQKAGATRYISGPAAKDYIDPQAFEDAGIDLIWKDYSGYPEYQQNFLPFEHGVSIIDVLCNTGPNAGWYIWGWRNVRSPSF